MATEQLERVIDGDGHVMEDLSAVAGHMGPAYQRGGRDPFPPLDHLHAANPHTSPLGSFAPVELDGWIEFLDDVGIDETVLYTTRGLAFGKVISRDWAIELARAYNDWLYETYLSKSPRFKGMGLIPLQEPREAAAELRRIVRELGMCGAMLPSTGAAQAHLGDERYWPIYEEASRLGCALGIHGGAHENLGMDDLSPYAPVNALGHPVGQMVAFAGIVFNGIFDKYPGVRIGFLEAGAGWFLTCVERFDRSWASHVQHDPRGRFLDLRKGESLLDYICRHVDEGRIFVGVEGSEPTIPYAIDMVGNKPFIYSSDFPHEVNNETCKEEIGEVRESGKLSTDDKAAILHRNAERFYALGGAAG